jgi:hypothetical protein
LVVNRPNAVDRELGLKVCAKRCAECLFSSARIVSEERAEAVLSECERSGTYFICHKATLRGDAVVCRGFFDTGSNTLCRVAARFGHMTFVDEDGEPVPKTNQRSPAA